MSAWHAGPFLAFDTETTGVDCERDRIVTATTVWLDGNSAPEVTSWLIDPGIEIPSEASAIHGVTTEQVRNYGRPPVECVQEIVEVIHGAIVNGVPVLAFNAAFDLTILDREARRTGAPSVTPTRVLDPFVIDKAVDRYRRGKRTLTNQCEHYGVKHDGAHDATADAIAAARVMWQIARRYPAVGNLDLDELHAAQVEWGAQQAASFADYLRKQGRTDDLPDGQWPIRAYAPAGVAA